MIVIHITDEQGVVLGQTTITHEDRGTNRKLNPTWIGQKILDQLPSERDALHKLLDA